MLVLTFQTGSDRLALDVRRVREVVPHVTLQPVTGGAAWLAGIFIYRGEIVPVIDLHRLRGSGECPALLSTRIVLVADTQGSAERLIGLLAAQVAEVRDMQPGSKDGAVVVAPGMSELGPILADGSDIVCLVDLDRLLPVLGEHKALLPAEAPA